MEKRGGEPQEKDKADQGDEPGAEAKEHKGGAGEEHPGKQERVDVFTVRESSQCKLTNKSDEQSSAGDDSNLCVTEVEKVFEDGEQYRNSRG
jgi:hypothetical protein